MLNTSSKKISVKEIESVCLSLWRKISFTVDGMGTIGKCYCDQQALLSIVNNHPRWTIALQSTIMLQPALCDCQYRSASSNNS
jgi:hypothetical protein